LTMIVITKLVVRDPDMTVMTMIIVLMTAANHLLDAYIPHMTVMIITSVPLKNVPEDNVIMNELTATIKMLVLMTAVNQILAVNTLNMNVMTAMLVLMTTVPKKVGVCTTM